MVSMGGFGNGHGMSGRGGGCDRIGGNGQWVEAMSQGLLWCWWPRMILFGYSPMWSVTVRDWSNRDPSVAKRGNLFKKIRIFVPFFKMVNFSNKKSCKIELKKFGQITKLALKNCKIDIKMVQNWYRKFCKSWPKVDTNFDIFFTQKSKPSKNISLSELAEP